MVNWPGLFFFNLTTRFFDKSIPQSRMVTSLATEKLFSKFCCLESKQNILNCFLLFSFFFTNGEQSVSTWGETTFFLLS